MSIDLSDTTNDGILTKVERIRKAPSPGIHYVTASKHDLDTLTHVDRDPCPRCGVRGDIGCKHRRRA